MDARGGREGRRKGRLSVLFSETSFGGFGGSGRVWSLRFPSPTREGGLQPDLALRPPSEVSETRGGSGPPVSYPSSGRGQVGMAANRAPPRDPLSELSGEVHVSGFLNRGPPSRVWSGTGWDGCASSTRRTWPTKTARKSGRPGASERQPFRKPRESRRFFL